MTVFVVIACVLSVIAIIGVILLSLLANKEIEDLKETIKDDEIMFDRKTDDAEIEIKILRNDMEEEIKIRNRQIYLLSTNFKGNLSDNKFLDDLKNSKFKVDVYDDFREIDYNEVMEYAKLGEKCCVNSLYERIKELEEKEKIINEYMGA